MNEKIERIKQLMNARRMREAKLEIGELEQDLEKAESLKNKICKLIEQDIEFQKKQLKGDHEKDKAVKWRIMGFEALLKKIK